MSRESGSSVIPVAVFLALLLIILPVSAENATLTQTTVAINETTVAPPQTTVASNVTSAAPTQTTTLVPAQTTAATNMTTIATTQTTVTPQKTTATVVTPATIVTPATVVTLANSTTGNVNVYSSPTGASILIDGVYSGTTPKTVYTVPAGNHILRLSMSGYHDYEGSIYVVPGQENQGYGTLQPLSPVSATPTAVATVVIPVVIPVTPSPVPTQDTGLLGNSSVLVAIIGAISVLIAAGASVFTHVKPPKKE